MTTNKTLAFTQQYTKQNVPKLRSGDTVRVHERIIEKDKERIQVFEGLVIARKHGTVGPNATFTVRKISHGVGVEKTFPLHSPAIQKIEVVKHDKVRRAKLYYVRDLHKKKKKKKASKMLGMVYEEEVEEPEAEVAEESAEETTEETPEEQTIEQDPKKQSQASTKEEKNE